MGAVGPPPPWGLLVGPRSGYGTGKPVPWIPSQSHSPAGLLGRPGASWGLLASWGSPGASWAPPGAFWKVPATLGVHGHPIKLGRPGTPGDFSLSSLPSWESAGKSWCSFKLPKNSGISSNFLGEHLVSVQISRGTAGIRSHPMRFQRLQRFRRFARESGEALGVPQSRAEMKSRSAFPPRWSPGEFVCTVGGTPAFAAGWECGLSPQLGAIGAAPSSAAAPRRKLLTTKLLATSN